MTVRLFVAPAASGKTEWVVRTARDRARGLASVPIVCVPYRPQVDAIHRRLVEAGGAAGVDVFTVPALFVACLRACGTRYELLDGPASFRVVMAAIGRSGLEYYAPIAGRSGFGDAVAEVLRELESTRTDPDVLDAALAEMCAEPRLVELAAIYRAHRADLAARGWLDHASLGRAAVDAVESCPDALSGWDLVVFDGFDDLTRVQLDLLRALAPRVGELVVTLTGDPRSADDRLVMARADRTRRRLEDALGVAAEPLPVVVDRHAPPLRRLERRLFTSAPVPGPEGAPVTMIGAPDRPAEVRAALRWLKERIVLDGVAPEDTALLARDMEPYRPFVAATAGEMGLPLDPLDGSPLSESPVVAAVLGLLALRLPAPGAGDGLRRRAVVDAWSSPYLDWTDVMRTAGAPPIDDDAVAALDQAGRAGLVIAGEDQWREAFRLIVDAEGGAPGAAPDDARRDLPAAAAARDLECRFGAFAERVTPPPVLRYRDLVAWVEGLIGPDEALDGREDDDRQLDAEAPPRQDLRVAERARAAADAPDPDGRGVELAVRDVRALEAFKEILRSLIWAEEHELLDPPSTFASFFEEMAGAVKAARLEPPPRAGGVVVGSVLSARGVAMRAVAVLGLAEGEFPQPQREDVLLRDGDRARLAALGIDLDPPDSESAFFHAALTRPRESILLLRPRLADNGARWQASPYWDEVRGWTGVRPVDETHATPVPLARACSRAELLAAVAAAAWSAEARRPLDADAGVGACGAAPDGALGGHLDAEWSRVELAAEILRARASGRSAYDGDLGALAAELRRVYGPGTRWSATGLETYRSCPFQFLVGRALGLEEVEEPEEGLGAAQLGTIVHEVLEHLYRSAPDPTDAAALLASVDRVARPLLAGAPDRHRFRPPAWWPRTQDRIVEWVRLTVQALSAEGDDYVPAEFEWRFGDDAGQVEIGTGDGRIRLRGVVDRIDVAPDGRVRLIDYKTAGPWVYAPGGQRGGAGLLRGVAACGDHAGTRWGGWVAGGRVADGFYWHVRQAEPSALRLAKVEGGIDAATRTAVEWARQAVEGASAGRFGAVAPPGGCPDYCVASAFCWHRRSAR